MKLHILKIRLLVSIFIFGVLIFTTHSDIVLAQSTGVKVLGIHTDALDPGKYVGGAHVIGTGDFANKLQSGLTAAANKNGILKKPGTGQSAVNDDNKTLSNVRKAGVNDTALIEVGQHIELLNKYNNPQGVANSPYVTDLINNTIAPNVQGDGKIILVMDHTKKRIPDTTGGNTFTQSDATGAAEYKGFSERDVTDAVAVKIKAKFGNRVTIIRPEDYKSYQEYDAAIVKAIGGSPTTATNTPTSPTSSSQLGTPGGSTGSETGLVKCGVSRDCTICDIFILIRDIFNFALGLLASLAVLSIVIGGVYILTSAGNPGGVSTGYGIITNAVIGLLLVMSSFLLFSFLLVGLGFQEQNFSAVFTFQSGKIFEVKCDNASTFNDNGSNGAGGATTGGGSGNVGSLSVACVDANNISDEASAILRTISLYEGVSTRKGYFTIQGYSYAPENTIQHPARIVSSSDAYGRYQMLSTTWPGWAAAAGVPKNSNGTFNISPQYQDAAVAKFLQTTGISTCDSFAASAKRNAGTYGQACQWTSIPGCATQSNPTTAKYPDAAATCKQLLKDEQTGACKQ
jgi:muramidase (phage lysozyme)